MTESPTNDEQQPGTEVTVEVSGCHEKDAQAVFEALRASFASDRGAGDVPHEAAVTRPTVWAATFDIGAEATAARPSRLAAPVTLDVQGGYHAVDRLRATLATVFDVRVVGTASGDQENEVQLRLDNRRPGEY